MFQNTKRNSDGVGKTDGKTQRNRWDPSLVAQKVHSTTAKCHFNSLTHPRSSALPSVGLIYIQASLGEVWSHKIFRNCFGINSQMPKAAYSLSDSSYNKINDIRRCVHTCIWCSHCLHILIYGVGDNIACDGKKVRKKNTWVFTGGNSLNGLWYI